MRVNSLSDKTSPQKPAGPGLEQVLKENAGTISWIVGGGVATLVGLGIYKMCLAVMDSAARGMAYV